MKTLFFDAGPVITLVMSRLAWILPLLKEKLNGKFYITPAVKYELVDRPLTTRRFELEALEVLKLIREGVLEVNEDVSTKRVSNLKKLANNSFHIGKKAMDVVQEGELEAVTSVLNNGNSALVMDERTLRLFIENNKEMKSLLERRFKNKVTADQAKMDLFSKQFKGVSIIRSIELVGVAYQLGLLNNYLPKRKDAKTILLDAVLWATKYNGCAVTRHEIEEIKKYLL